MGCIMGWILASVSPQTPPFLSHVPMLSKQYLSTKRGGGSITYYTMPLDWKQVIAQAKLDFPQSLSRETNVAGLRAKVLTVPRVVNGRIQLFDPPQEEITFMPHRLAIGKNGRVVAVENHDQPWTGVERHVYHREWMLDDLIDWVQRQVK